MEKPRLQFTIQEIPMKDFTILDRIAAWYTCAALLLAFTVSMFVTVIPNAQARFAMLQAGLGGAAIVMALISVILTILPKGHWVHRSFAVRGVLLFTAFCSTLLSAVSVG